VSSPEPARAPEVGTQFLAEIREQPRALERLLEHDAEFARVAAAARDRADALVRMVGHGSSDNAASYGIYAFGLLPPLDGAPRLDHALGLLRHRHGRRGLARGRALAVRADAGGRRVRAARQARVR
jgi:hypothetical protein